jgi:hypothetical protein
MYFIPVYSLKFPDCDQSVTRDYRSTRIVMRGESAGKITVTDFRGSMRELWPTARCRSDGDPSTSGVF